MLSQAQLKNLILYTAKFSGLFAAARAITRHKVRIIAYHGIALDDEYAFRPKLFMRPKTFSERLDWLSRAGYQLLDLDQAEEVLSGKRNAHLPTVITIDDGWKGTYLHALPALEQRRMPATIYVTTYHVEQATPVFDVALGYVLWRTHLSTIDLSCAHSSLSGQRDIATAADRNSVANELTTFAYSSLDEDGRLQLLHQLGGYLQVELETRLATGCFRLMSREQVTDSAERGFAIELHTHRHTLSLSDESALEQEIADNRTKLAALTGQEPAHLCYPSGVFNRLQWPWLTARGIKTATCTFPGLCDRQSQRLALPRLVDDDAMSLLEFEAELSGFMDLVRYLRGGKGHFSHYETPATQS